MRRNNKDEAIGCCSLIIIIFIITLIVGCIKWIGRQETWIKALIITAIILIALLIIAIPILIKVYKRKKIKNNIKYIKNKSYKEYPIYPKNNLKTPKRNFQYNPIKQIPQNSNNNYIQKEIVEQFEKNDNISNVSNDNTTNVSNNIQKYDKKASMTETELVFWKKLKKIFGNQYIITPQIPLSSVIKKNIDSYYASELNRIIDFGIFTKEEYELIALIELNDSTHLEKKRQQRDLKVKEILTQAGLGNKLVTFWTNMPNEETYIYKRISNLTSKMS